MSSKGGGRPPPGSGGKTQPEAKRQQQQARAQGQQPGASQQGSQQRGQPKSLGPEPHQQQQQQSSQSGSAWGAKQPQQQRPQPQTQPRAMPASEVKSQQQPQSKAAWGLKPQQQQQQSSQPGSAWGPKEPQQQRPQPQPRAMPASEVTSQQQLQSKTAWGLKPQQQQQQQQQPPQKQESTSGTEAKKSKKKSQQLKSSSKSGISMFPPKPARIHRAPGNPVQLITNLFKISLKTNKPIYRYGVDVEPIEDGDAQFQRKLPKEIRLPAVREALKMWTSNNGPDPTTRGLTYSYVLDSNGSIVFALFNMFGGDTGDINSIDISVEIPVDTMKDKRMIIEKKRFRVKLSDGAHLNVRELIDYCEGKGSKDYSLLLDHIRALNTILHGQIVTMQGLVVSQSKSGVGAVFPYNRDEQFGISPGVICNKGTTLSVRLTENGLALNVANTVAPFYEPKELIEFIKIRYRVNDPKQGLSRDQIESMKRDLKNKQVEALHINYGKRERPHFKKYRIHDIAGSGKHKFKSKDSQGREFETTIEAYFEKEYPQHKLKYPNLPCVVDNGRYLPLEVCRIVDKQKVSRKLEPLETSNVIKQAALKPEIHFKQVEKNVNNVSRAIKPFEDFGLALDCKPIEVDGRELPQIELLCGGGRRVRASGGQYDIRRDRFLVPATIKRWCICILVDDFISKDGQYFTQNANKFSDFYCRSGRSKGVTISSPARVDFIPQRPPLTLTKMDEEVIKAELKKYFVKLNDEKFDFAIILLPDRIDWIYGYIQYLETLPDVKKTRPAGEKCTRTSCIKYDNYKRKIIEDRSNGEMFLSNLWLKHNVKLGGVNVALNKEQEFGLAKLTPNFLSDGYLYISIDVCHPAPGDKFMQSVAAMVGMWDLTSVQISHSTRLRVQAKQRSKNDLSTVEEVGEIGVLFEDILRAYIRKKGKEPTHIVVLRDGVSEGQFKMVLEFELQKMKSVLTKIAKGAKLACLTVQKRHRIRFKRVVPVKNFKGIEDYNIQPGTVVDHKITHPNDFSFYLAPHKAIQGTAKAPYIYMIYDDIGFDQDTAQAMIHALSYLSPRCTKGTSIPTPINLADLAAERGKNIIIAWSSHNSPKKEEQDEFLPRLNAHLSNLGDEHYKDTLYYV